MTTNPSVTIEVHLHVPVKIDSALLKRLTGCPTLIPAGAFADYGASPWIDINVSIPQMRVRLDASMITKTRRVVNRYWVPQDQMWLEIEDTARDFAKAIISAIQDSVMEQFRKHRDGVQP